MTRHAPFVGRAELVHAISAALLPTGAHVHLYGAPGVGKSRLAEEIARSLPPQLAVRVVERDHEGPPATRARPSERLLFVGRARPTNEMSFLVPPLTNAECVTLLRLLVPTVHESAAFAAIAEAIGGLPFAATLLPPSIELFGVDETCARLARTPIDLVGWDALEALHGEVWNALHANERVAFSIAASFGGPFRANDFEALARDVSLEKPLDRLHALWRASLVSSVPSGGAVTFAVAPLLCRFVQRESAADRALQASRARHRVARAEALAEKTYGAGADDALRDLADDKDALLSVADAAYAEGDAETASRAWLSLYDAILFRGAVDLSDARFAAHVAIADATKKPAYRVRARLLASRASLEVTTPQTAIDLAEAARAIAAESGLPDLAAEADRAVGWAALAMGQLDMARARFEAASAAHAERGNVRGEADALGALGLVTALEGSARAAEPLFGLSLALHERAGETIRGARVREMAELVGAASKSSANPDATELLAAAAEHAARGERWREAIALGRWAEKADGDGNQAGAEVARARARRLAEKARVQVPAVVATSHAASTGSNVAAWSVGPEARWLVDPNGQKYDLTRHGSLRRALDALVVARLDHPGQAIGASDLLAAGWPGERMLHDAGMLRVYTTVRRLRRLGLEPLLVTRDDGYLLDPAQTVTRVP